MVYPMVHMGRNVSDGSEVSFTMLLDCRSQEQVRALSERLGIKTRSEIIRLAIAELHATKCSAPAR